MPPFSLLIKPTGPDCNIACRYCFYCRKKELFGDGKHRMSDEVMRELVRNYLAAKMQVHSFAWQGGEPCLMGLDFYQRLVETQQKIGKGQTVSNALQTNGTLLDEQWASFLAQYNWLVGISVDGPKKYHDYYRLDAAGKGTFDRVMAGVEACKSKGVEFNILVLLNDRNVEAPDELFDFFTAELGVQFLQFVPCVETDAHGKLTDFSVTPAKYGEFMCRIFDRWVEYGVRKLSVRLFDSLLNYVINGCHTNCTFGRKCSDYIVIEHNGDAYCCDFFVEPKWRLGSIMEKSVEELANCEVKQVFAREKGKIDTKCLICRHSRICRGGCLKDRLAVDGTFSKPSFLCEAYKRIFDYTVPRIRQIAADFLAGSR